MKVKLFKKSPVVRDDDHVPVPSIMIFVVPITRPVVGVIVKLPPALIVNPFNIRARVVAPKVNVPFTSILLVNVMVIILVVLARVTLFHVIPLRLRTAVDTVPPTFNVEPVVTTVPVVYVNVEVRK